MFGAFKRIFKKEPETLPSAPPPAPQKPVPSKPESKPAAVAPKPIAAPATALPTAEKPVATASSGDNLSLPLKSVVARLPNALATLVSATSTGNCNLPIKLILTQLPKGIVKVPFGMVRAGSPTGTFIDNAVHDQTLIEIPLPEILSRLDKSHLALRPDQKKVAVPEDVKGVFGDKGGVIAPPPGTQFFKKNEAAATVSTEEVAAPIAFPSAPTVSKTPQPAPPASAPAPVPPAIRSDTSTFKRDLPPGMSRPVSTAPVVPKTAAGCLSIELSALRENWPDGIRNEIGLQDATVELPLNRVEEGLKAGRITFTWTEIRKWTKPAPLSMTSRGETTLELPLKVVVPIFFAQHRPTFTQKKVEIGDNIPDLFSATGAPAAAAPAAPAPSPEPAAPAIKPSEPIPFKMSGMTAPVAPTPPPVQAAPGPSQAVIDKLASSLTPTSPIVLPKPAAAAAAATTSRIGEIFGAPYRNDWSPQEIVQKTSSLKGVSGSLIAMSDGLLVAAQIPPALKAETISAFLPQIFGRMNQYAKELQFGELSGMTLMFGNVPCQIFRHGTVFFLAFGQGGESLPSAQLEIIAAEVAKRNK